MAAGKLNHRMVDKFAALTQCAPDSDMGKLLRTFWQPVALSSRVAPGKAVPLRILGEDLTLYRGESGTPHLIGGRCAHRGTLLHTGWVQGDQLRCIYHGWCYDGAGRCTERPAEADTTPPKIGIEGYPARDYCGLIFAYMGPGQAPAFELPRKSYFEKTDAVTVAREQPWPCNWFQVVENSLDAVHVSFVHQAGKVGPFGAAVTGSLPKQLDYIETESGIRQIATRGPDNVRVSDWTFPNNNHIVVPGPKGFPWVHNSVWRVPVDEDHTVRFSIFGLSTDEETKQRLFAYCDKYGDYNPADHHDELFAGSFPEETFFQLTSSQDYVAIMGQGPVANRTREHLGKSDRGVALLRQIFWREMEALKAGEPTKQWRPLAEAVDMPMPEAARAAAGTRS